MNHFRFKLYFSNFRIILQWQNTEYVLSFFGQNRYRRRSYQQYVQKGVALGRRPELVGGGLVRSLGGWSEVLALKVVVKSKDLINEF